MANRVIALINRLKDLRITEVFQVKEVQDYIIYLNRHEQLFLKGETVEGDLTGFYSLKTQFITEGKGYTSEGVTKYKKAGDPFFFLDTNDFFNSFKVKVGNEYFTIEANDKKDDGYLSEKYGHIIGLSEESKSKLVEFIKPYIVEVARKATFG